MSRIKTWQHPLVLAVLALPLLFLCVSTECHRETLAPDRGSEPANSGLERDSLKIREYYDLPYYQGPDAHPKKHGLNLFIPEGVANPPLMLWIHGGAWAFGGRTLETDLARKFAAEGIAVAAVSYRLSPGSWQVPERTEGIQHPGHIRDIAKAFAWLWSHSGQYGYDRNSIFVSGYSAGGHLSALLALDPTYLEEVGRSVRDIRGALPIAGAYDIEAYYKSHLRANGQALADGHVKGAFGQTMEALRGASPTTYAAHAWVPMLTISEQETYDYTRLFEEAAREAANDRIAFHHVRDRDHKSLYAELSKAASSPTRQVMLRFMREHAVKYNYLKRPGLKIAYRVIGSGKPLFLLNGGPGYASHHFLPLARRLAKDYQVIVFDQRGTGFSELEAGISQETITIELMLEDLEALRDHLGFEAIHLMGHSFGGMYASLYASRYPDRVASMILSHSGGLNMDFTKGFNGGMQARLSPEAQRTLREIPYPPEGEMQQMQRARAIAPAYVSDMQYADEVYRGLAFRGRFTPLVNQLVFRDLRRTEYDLRSVLSDFPAPVLLLHGSKDIVNPALAERDARIFPKANLVMLNSGHYGWIEQPQAYFKAIRDFLGG